MEERRKYIRFKVSVNVKWARVVDSIIRLPSKDDLTKNISVGGICLFVDEKFERGDVLDLLIELPTKKIIHTRGLVRWVKEYEDRTKQYDIGVEFLEISDSERVEIINFAFQFLSDQHEDKGAV